MEELFKDAEGREIQVGDEVLYVVSDRDNFRDESRWVVEIGTVVRYGAPDLSDIYEPGEVISERWRTAMYYCVEGKDNELLAYRHDTGAYLSFAPDTRASAAQEYLGQLTEITRARIAARK